jgi:hypothetical protein
MACLSPEGHFRRFFQWAQNKDLKVLRQSNKFFTIRPELGAVFTSTWCPNFFYLLWLKESYRIDLALWIADANYGCKNDFPTNKLNGVGSCPVNSCGGVVNSCVIPRGQLVEQGMEAFPNFIPGSPAPTPRPTNPPVPVSSQCQSETDTIHASQELKTALESIGTVINDVESTSFVAYGDSSGYALICQRNGGSYYSQSFELTCTAPDGEKKQLVVSHRPACFAVSCESASDLANLFSEHAIQPTEALANEKTGKIWTCVLAQEMFDDETFDICAAESAQLAQNQLIKSTGKALEPSQSDIKFLFLFTKKNKRISFIEDSKISNYKDACEEGGGKFQQVENFKMICSKKGGVEAAGFEVSNFPTCFGGTCGVDNQVAVARMLSNKLVETNKLDSGLICEVSGAFSVSVGLTLMLVFISVWKLAA